MTDITLEQRAQRRDEFCDAIEARHGYRPRVRDGEMVNGRDADRFDGWMLATEALRLSAGAVADALDASRYRRLKALPIEIRWNSYLSIFPGLLDGHDHILDAEIDKEEAAPRHETGEG